MVVPAADQAAADQAVANRAVVVQGAAVLVVEVPAVAVLGVAVLRAVVPGAAAPRVLARVVSRSVPAAVAAVVAVPRKVAGKGAGLKVEDLAGLGEVVRRVLGEDGFPQNWNEDMKQGWREMDEAIARGDQQAADQAFRKVIAADDRPGQKYPVGWQQDVTEPGGGGWGDTSGQTGGSNSNGDPKHGHRLRVRERSANSSSSSPSSDPNNVDQLGKTQAQDLVLGATCPVPCASPLATSQAGLGNMTQLLGKH